MYCRIEPVVISCQLIFSPCWSPNVAVWSMISAGNKIYQNILRNLNMSNEPPAKMMVLDSNKEHGRFWCYKFWKNMCITSTALVFRLLSDFCPTGRGQSIENAWWNWAFARIRPSLPKCHQMLQPPCRCKVVNLALVSGRSLLHETVRTSCIMSGCRLSIIQTPSSKCSGSCGALSWMVKILRANGYYHIYAWQWHVLRGAATESQAKMPPKKTQWKGSIHRSQMPNRLPTCSFWPDQRSWNLQDTCTQVHFPLLLSLLMKFASSSRIEPYKI